MQKILIKTAFKLIILFLTFPVFSQTLENIKKTDTVFIYYNKSVFEKKIKPYKSKSNFINDILIYYFEQDAYNTILFQSGEYMDFNSFEDGKKSDVKIVRKSFLRKNKNKILDVDFFLRNGFKETFFAIYGKVIYLIDEEEIIARKVKVKQVRLDNYTYFEQ